MADLPKNLPAYYYRRTDYRGSAFVVRISGYPYLSLSIMVNAIVVRVYNVVACCFTLAGFTSSVVSPDYNLYLSLNELPPLHFILSNPLTLV